MAEGTAKLMSSSGAPTPVQASAAKLEILAALLLLLEMPTSYMLALAEHGDIAEATGEALGAPIFVLLVIGAFRAFGKAKTRRSKATIACWVLGLTLVGQFSRLGQEQRNNEVTNAERTGLTIEGDLIRHQTLGFSLPHPGSDFQFKGTLEVPAPERLRGGFAAWALSDTARSRAVVVELVKGFRITRESLTKFGTGMRETIDTGRTTVFLDAVRWNDTGHDYRLSALSASGMYIEARCLPSNTTGRTGFIVCVMTLAPDSTSLAFVKEGLQLAPR